jgi:hypothetical protein
MKAYRPTSFPILLFAAVSLIALSFNACSTSSKATLSVRIVNAPATLTINQSVNLSASVFNDSSHAGVDWTCSSTAGACGTFDPDHTASSVTTAFTAPATAGTVTITATASAVSGVKATATITVVPIGSNAMLNGPYVFSVQGVDSNGTYSAAGMIIADGNGNITAGEQDYSDSALQAGPDSVTGSYSIGPNGLGSMTLNVNNTSLPNNGVETFSIAVTSATHALIIQFDGTANASGNLDSQAANAPDPAGIGGAFAFTVQGEDSLNSVPITYGGVLALSASLGTVNSGTYFSNDGGSISTGSVTGTMTAPDPLGRGTIALDIGLNFSYYAVQGQVLRLVSKNYPYIVAGGGIYGQGSAGANATFSNASLTGDHVFFEAGGSFSGGLALAGQLSADGVGHITAGAVDTNNAGTRTSSSIAGLASYAINGDGTGTLTLPVSVDTLGNIHSLVIFAIDPAINILDPNSATGGGGALVMDYDVNAVGTGCIVPRTSGAFDGNYALNLGFVSSIGATDWVGQTVAASGNLTGSVDINASGATSAGVALTGTFTADAGNAGRWTGTFTVSSTHYTISYYQVSPTLFVIVDMDSTVIGIGIMEKE